MNLNYGNGFMKALLIPVLLIFSCDQSKPVCDYDYYKDAGRCPVCPVYSEDASLPRNTIEEIEGCVENCLSESNCFFSFSSKACFKKCSTKCLKKFGCSGVKK